MNTTDSIEHLIMKLGVVQISLGKNPDVGETNYVMELNQFVDTANKGVTRLIHKVIGDSVVDCLQQAKAQCEHAREIPLGLSRKN